MAAGCFDLSQSTHELHCSKMSQTMGPYLTCEGRTRGTQTCAAGPGAQELGRSFHQIPAAQQAGLRSQLSRAAQCPSAGQSCAEHCSDGRGGLKSNKQEAVSQDASVMVLKSMCAIFWCHKKCCCWYDMPPESTPTGTSAVDITCRSSKGLALLCIRSRWAHDQTDQESPTLLRHDLKNSH